MNHLKQFTIVISNNRWFFALFSMFVGLHSFLLSSQRLYPFVDLPNHLAASTIVRYYNDPTNKFDQYFNLDNGVYQPNTFHLNICGLKLFTNVEASNRVLLCLYLLGLPLVTMLIINKVGGNRWFSLLAFLFLYNFDMQWGFMGFTLAIPILLLYCYFLFKLQDKPTILIRVLLATFLIIIYYMHAQASLISLLLFYLGYIPFARPKLKIVSSDIGTTIPVILLWQRWLYSKPFESGPSLWQYLHKYYQVDYWATLATRINLLSFDQYPFTEIIGYQQQQLWGIFISLCIIMPVVIYACQKQIKNVIIIRDPHRYTLYVWTTLTIFCCIVLPGGLPGQRFIYQRIGVISFLFMICVGSLVRIKNNIPFERGFIFLLVLIHFVIWSGYLNDFQRENCNFTSDIFPVEGNGYSLGGLMVDFKFKNSPAYIHFPSYYIVWRHGIAATNLIDYRFTAIRRKIDSSFLPIYDEWVGRKMVYDGRYQNMKYILVRREVPDWDLTQNNDSWAFMKGNLKGFKLKKGLEAWGLFEKEPPSNLTK